MIYFSVFFFGVVFHARVGKNLDNESGIYCPCQVGMTENVSYVCGFVKVLYSLWSEKKYYCPKA